MILARSLLCLALLGAPLALAAQAHPACPGDGPGPRSGHVMAWDATLGEVVLFGGLSPRAEVPFPRSLWAWNGTRWRCLAPTGPAGRIDAHLAFDAARGRLVLFGGRQLTRDRRSIFLADTWEWDGAAWTRADTAGPAPRVHGTMAYDAARGAVVLHGGGGAEAMRDDTWEWRDGAWRAVAVALPAGTMGNALVALDRGFVLVGAVRDSQPGCTDNRRASLAVLRGDALRALAAPTADAPCFSPQVPVAALREGLLLYAGWNAPGAPPESWRFAGAWHRVDGAQPPRRRGAAMAFDARRGRAVLYGGDGDAGLRDDLWESDGVRWWSAP